MMKNLLLVSLGLILLVSVEAQINNKNPHKGTQKPDIGYDALDEVPHGLPLQGGGAQCLRSYPITIHPYVPTTPTEAPPLPVPARRNVTKRGDTVEDSDHIHEYGYYDFAHLPVALGEDWSIAFMIMFHYYPMSGQVLLHLGDGYNNQIELRMESHYDEEGEKKRGDHEDYVTLDLIATPSAEKGGMYERVFISSDMYDDFYPYQWYHVVASHKNGCNKQGSGLKLNINTVESYEPYYKHYNGYDYAFIPPTTPAGKPFARRNQYFGMGYYDEKRAATRGKDGFPYAEDLYATFDCVDFYNKAVTDGEIQSLYTSAKRVLKQADRWDYE